MCVPYESAMGADVMTLVSSDAMVPFDSTNYASPMSSNPWHRAVHAIVFAWECHRRIEEGSLSVD
jgi:hypothetical protein